MNILAKEDELTAKEILRRVTTWEEGRLERRDK